MAHYFIAHNQGANYNNPEGFDYVLGWEEAQKALEISQRSSLMEWEKALVEVQVHRFFKPPVPQCLDELNMNYANAMRPVYQKFGEDDPDITAFFAESLMMLAPWRLWTPHPDSKPAILETEELVAVLEKSLEKYPRHPGLLHFYIHAMELSPTPAKALNAADILRFLEPEHGHLLHMPSHIDMWVGQYAKAVDANKRAVEADERYVKKVGSRNEFYTMYRFHNYHFAVWAAMFDGQYATAMKYAEILEDQLGPDIVTCMLEGTDMPMGSKLLEAFGGLPWHVLIRFGKWQEIVKRPLKDKDLYPSAVATSHYARSIAYAVMGQIKEADAERARFSEALKSKALEGRYLHNNVMHDSKCRSGILDVAEAVMDGEVEYHKGNHKQAFEHLHLAVKRDTSLLYDEPWGWMMPARHVLGALLLESGEASAAESVYREDLQLYPNNLWSLLGLHQALKALKRVEEAERVHVAFQTASARADIKVEASCLCATKLCCQ